MCRISLYTSCLHTSKLSWCTMWSQKKQQRENAHKQDSLSQLHHLTTHLWDRISTSTGNSHRQEAVYLFISLWIQINPFRINFSFLLFCWPCLQQWLLCCGEQRATASTHVSFLTKVSSRWYVWYVWSMGLGRKVLTCKYGHKGAL